MAKTTKTIAFDTDRDADLLAWLGAQKNVSRAVRDALRSAITPTPSQVTLDRVYRAIKDLESRIQFGSVVIQAEQSNGDAPGTEEAASTLNSLGL
jgi:hypothetical protein